MTTRRAIVASLFVALSLAGCGDDEGPLRLADDDGATADDE